MSRQWNVLVEQSNRAEEENWWREANGLQPIPIVRVPKPASEPVTPLKS